MQDKMPPVRPSRRQLLAGAGLAAAALSVAGRTAAETPAAGAASDKADFLFVQTAKGMRYDADLKRLTLTSASPVTLFFSDRPERIAGNMETAAFVPFWSEGKDSFLSDPPNADLSVLRDGKLHQTVVVLHDPVLEGEDLHYTVDIVDGEMPATGQDVSVFIDIIGMPATPLSYAGVARRSYRRAVLY